MINYNQLQQQLLQQQQQQNKRKNIVRIKINFSIIIEV